LNTSYYSEIEIKKYHDDFSYEIEDLPKPFIVAEFPHLITYQARSPDELALLHFARECGWILYSIHDKKVEIIINHELFLFPRPVFIEFYPERKRSSCVIEDNGVDKLE
jgi:phospholipid-transporting ATPase